MSNTTADASSKLDLPVQPLRLLRMFLPLGLLLPVSLWLHWDKWVASPWYLVVVIASPLLLIAGVWLFRDRWRLTLTRDALEHHTLWGVQRYPWRRMGPVAVGHGPGRASAAQTLTFAYPTDTPTSLRERMTAQTGLRILAIFGPADASALAEQVESWRQRYGGQESAYHAGIR